MDQARASGRGNSVPGLLAADRGLVRAAEVRALPGRRDGLTPIRPTLLS